MFKLKLHWQILIALIFGVIAGTLIQRAFGLEAKDTLYVGILKFFGNTVFIGLLKMVIVPLIFSSIVAGIAGRKNSRGFGRLGLKTLGYYLLTSSVAILIGLSVVNLMKPGLIDGQPNPELVKFMSENSEEFEKKGASVGKDATGLQEKPHPLGVVGSLIERMIPENVFESASDNGSMLSLIFISIITAFGLLSLQGPTIEAVTDLIIGVNKLMIKITGWIMKLAPLGVFGLMGWTISQTGPSFLLSMSKYMIAVILALGIHFFIVLPLMIFFLAKVNPIKHFYAMKEALLTSFSTASSSATLPVTLKCLQQNAGVSKRVSSFVLPLGATVNMDGTALYECVAVLFIGQVMGVTLDFSAQLSIVILALLTSIGVAGVPSASLVAIVIILQNVVVADAKLDGALAAIGAIYAVDRILDMCRTSVNVFSDSCGAVIVARSEGEELLLGGTDSVSSGSLKSEK